MQFRTKKIAIPVIVLALIGFFIVPVIYINTGGQGFFLGTPISEAPTGECATFGCHCQGYGSLSYWLIGVGYFVNEGCP